MPVRLAEAEQVWRIQVMTLFGPWCYLHRARDPGSRIRAMVLVHVVDPAGLPPSLVFATFRTGRPVCEACAAGHAAGDPMCRFPYSDALDAMMAHNEAASAHKLMRRYRRPLPKPHRSAWDPAPWESGPTRRRATYVQTPEAQRRAQNNRRHEPTGEVRSRKRVMEPPK